MKNIFISSTFRDMQAERDLVQERVLPELRDKARKYGENVGVIDLRWGVDTSELESDEGSRKVLSVCLDEIERSHPYMLIFMGERYGWIPDSKMIQSAVEGKADKLVLDDYEKSITALEIEFGALSETYGELDKCVVCMRSPLAHLIMAENERKIYLEENPKAVEKLQKLQQKMRDKLGNRIIEYTAEWNENKKVFENFRTVDGQALEEAISNAYLAMFEKDWEAFAKLTWQQREQLEVQAVMENRLKSFSGREKLLVQGRKQLEEKHLLIVRGEVGSGKTSIMCKLMQMLESEGKKVFRFISGNTANSSSKFDLLRQMVWFMEEMLGMEEHFGNHVEDELQELSGLQKEEKMQSKYDEWKDYLESLSLRLSNKKEVYFCLDAVDQLLKGEQVKDLDFIPRIKENIYIVVSVATDFECPYYYFMTKGIWLQVPLLTKEEAIEVIQGLSLANSKNVYGSICKAMMEKKDSGNPLYLSFLMQRLNMMDQEELRDATGEQEIVNTSVRMIREVPEHLEEASVYMLKEAMERLAEDGEKLKEILNLLTISRNGLRKEDLAYILSAQSNIYPTLDMTRMLKYLEGFFVLHSDGRIDFGHKVIRNGLRARICDIKSWQRKVLACLKNLPSEDDLRNREGMYFARVLEDIKFAEKLIYDAHKDGNIELKIAIAEEAKTDLGYFYGTLLEKLANEEKNEFREDIIKYFLDNNLNKFVYVQPETLEYCYVKLCQCCEMLFKREPNASNMRSLFISYFRMGNICIDQNRYAEAEKYYEKVLPYMEQIYKAEESFRSMRELLWIYDEMARVCSAQGRYEESDMYHNKCSKIVISLRKQLETLEV